MITVDSLVRNPNRIDQVSKLEINLGTVVMTAKTALVATFEFVRIEVENDKSYNLSPSQPYMILLTEYGSSVAGG